MNTIKSKIGLGKPRSTQYALYRLSKATDKMYVLSNSFYDVIESTTSLTQALGNFNKALRSKMRLPRSKKKRIRKKYGLI